MKTMTKEEIRNFCRNFAQAEWNKYRTMHDLKPNSPESNNQFWQHIGAQHLADALIDEMFFNK